jgi:glycosyltransferase involved in cell wall biosynthesis
VVPVIKEVRSLHYTIDTIFSLAAESINEIIIVVCDKTTVESLNACDTLEKKYLGRIKIVKQRLPFLGGALREGLAAACGSHVIVMFSDGESDPRSVADLVKEARKNPAAIISASRWLKGNSFKGYPVVKTWLNFLFQKMFSILYRKKITDFTFGYRLYPMQLMQDIKWEETGHSFVFESILKPLTFNVHVQEIPSTWMPRSEGESQLKSYMYLRYLWVGCKVRITRPKRFLK